MGSKIVNKVLKLEGISCTACETKIENKLVKMNGVLEVEVSYVSSLVEIVYNENIISLKNIISAIEKLDYTVIQENENQTNNKQVNNKQTNNKQVNNKQMSNNKNASQNGNQNNSPNNNQLVIMGIIILGAYMIIKHTVGFNLIPEVNANMGYGILFVVGLMTSLHCVAMCGGINLSLCVSYKYNKDDNNKYSKLIPSLMYNAGRVISYTIIGGIVGALGSVFSISNTGSAFISILAGGFMVIMGLNMLNIFPWLRKFNPHMPKVFAKKIHSEKNNKGPLIVGMLNGLMPCGPLQAMQLYALGTGSFIAGAVSMFAFSLGTVPLLFAFGALGSMMSSKFSKNMMKASAMLVIVLGFVMVNRGVAFTGFTLDSFASSETSIVSENPTKVNPTTGNSATVNNATVSNAAEKTSVDESNFQEIKSVLQSNSYPALTVQAGVPVKWTITVDAKNLNGCNNQILIPEYKIKQKLVVGENVIKFTPSKTGKFGYSCWMGMIRSSITVTE